MRRVLFLLCVAGCLLGTVAASAAPSTKGRTAEAPTETAAYWCARDPNGDQVILDAAEVQKLNVKIQQRSDSIVALSEYPSIMSGDAIRSYMQQNVPGQQGLYTKGKPLTAVAYENALYERAIAQVQESNPVRYAVTTQRMDLRLLPVADGWFEDAADTHYDDLQATAVDPAEPVAVLGQSRSGVFSFVQMRNYRGWLETKKLAFTDYDHWMHYTAPARFLVVTKNLLTLRDEKQELLFQMGSRIPLIGKKGAGWQVMIPAVHNGHLQEHSIYLPEQGVHEGYLPYTRHTLLQQAFGFLGDVYGWGGMDHSVDCSGFVGDVYRTVGIELPRDARQQEKVFNTIVSLDGLGSDERLAAVQAAQPGDLLFRPGHVMMYLGQTENGQPMIIQSVSSYYTFADGVGTKHYVRRVLVSGLDFLNSRAVSTLDALTHIGSMQ